MAKSITFLDRGKKITISSGIPEMVHTSGIMKKQSLLKLDRVNHNSLYSQSFQHALKELNKPDLPLAEQFKLLSESCQNSLTHLQPIHGEKLAPIIEREIDYILSNLYTVKEEEYASYFTCGQIQFLKFNIQSSNPESRISALKEIFNFGKIRCQIAVIPLYNKIIMILEKMLLEKDKLCIINSICKILNIINKSLNALANSTNNDKTAYNDMSLRVTDLLIKILTIHRQNLLS